MDYKELAKVLIGIIGYLIAGPLLGYLIAGRRNLQRWCLGGILLMTALPQDLVTLTAFSERKYLGTAQGYEISFMEILAIALIIAAFRDDRGRWRLLPPGVKPYLLFCCLASLTALLLLPISWPTALVDLERDGEWIVPRYIWMAMFKFFKLALILIATHSVIRKKEDVLWLCGFIPAALCIVAVWALKDRYLLRLHRIQASFVHPNPMAVWAYMLGIPTLVLAFHRQVPVRLALWLFFGFGCAGVIVFLSVSRGGILFFSLATMLVIGLTTFRRFTGRTLIALMIVLMGFTGMVYKGLDTFLERNEKEGGDTKEGGYDLREGLIMQSRAMLHDSFLGVGWNNYPVACGKTVARYRKVVLDYEREKGQQVDDAKYNNPPVESLYWHVLAETGYLGFAGFVIFLCSTLWIAARTYWHHRNSLMGDMLLGVLLVLCIVYMHSYFERVLLFSKITVTWFILLGITSRAMSAMKARA